MVGRQLCNKASWTEKIPDVWCYSHNLKNNFFIQHSYFPCLYLVIQWYLLCASLARTLSPGHSLWEAAWPALPGITPNTVWLSPRALFTHGATVGDSADNYLSAMAGVQNLLCSVHTQIRHLPKSSATTSQGSSVAGEVLWLMQCMRAGVKSEQIFTMVPFDLSAD